MPRIDAASIEEHVRVQTARILDAASALFLERGYRKTDMDEIAQSVGLARNSLYRYYKNKDYILLACVERDMRDFVARMKALEAEHPDPLERIGAWLDMQVDFAVSPAHGTLEYMAEIRTEAPELRKRLMDLHKAPAAVLHDGVALLVRGKRRDTALIIALIKAMVEAAANEAMHRENKSAIKRELRRAVEGVIQC